MRNSPAVAVIFLLAVSSCGTIVRVERLGQQTYPARAPGSFVAVFESEADVEKPFVKIARLVGRAARDGSLTRASWEEILQDMKESARAIGGDAMVLRGEFRDSRRTKEAIAIRFTDSER